MFNSTNIYTIHENPNKSDPADRLELVREGFAFWAFVFTIFWLLWNRLWLPALLYIFAMILLQRFGEMLGLSPVTLSVLQLGLQFWLACNAYDIKRWMLDHRGYTMRGVVCAESPMMAQRRVLEAA